MRVCVCIHVCTWAKGVRERERIIEGSPMKGGRMSEEVRSWKAPSALIHGKEKTKRKGYCR